jgi:hypothetical protein
VRGEFLPRTWLHRPADFLEEVYTQKVRREVGETAAAVWHGCAGFDKMVASNPN